MFLFNKKSRPKKGICLVNGYKNSTPRIPLNDFNSNK
jgi:hypothetical protein